MPRLTTAPARARGGRSRPTPALRIAPRDRAAALRLARLVRRCGGLPDPADPRRYEFASVRSRDGALDAARSAFGWTSAEPDSREGFWPPVR